jgi:hypothetical protein
MDATRSAGYFDGGNVKTELSYGKERRDAPARKRDHRRPQSEIDAMKLWLNKKH